MKNNIFFTFVPGKRKYLFCGDKEGLKRLQPIITEVTQHKLPFETGEVESTDLTSWLGRQRMGSYLYVCVSWKRIRDLKLLAENIGFTEEESQYIGHGERILNIFCCRCHGLTPAPDSKSNLLISCSHCHLNLTISDHYSSLRDAYLGYTAEI
jgi:dimethylamine monooxygenase subunit C